MSNTIWYIGLAIVSVIIAAFAIFMKRNTYKVSTFLVFYLFSSGLTWVGEFIVLGLFNSYAYKTDLIQNPWAQNLIGHLLLNTSMFPAASTVMVAYSLRYGYFALAAALFVLAEYIFVRLGLYEQHWWRYYMSVINVFVFLWVARKWFFLINRKRYGLTRALTFLFVALILIHTPAPLLLLLGKQYYQLSLVNHLFGDAYRSSIFIAFSYHVFISGVYVYLICILKKWYWKLVPFIISFCVITLSAKLNILVIHEGWKLIYYILTEQIAIAIFILVEKYTLIPEQTR